MQFSIRDSVDTRRTAPRRAAPAIAWLAIALAGCVQDAAPQQAVTSAAVSTASAIGGTFGNSLAAGNSHTCAIVGGGVQCWGSSSNGQLGNGTSGGDSFQRVQVSGLTSGAQSVTAGGFHSCAIVNGAAKCWGSNDTGQLGNNTTTPMFTTPVQVLGLEAGVQAIAGGDLHTCAIVNGAAQCWGNNASGQLGNNSQTTSFIAPVGVSNLTAGVQAITTGGAHSCAIVDGGARCWGANDRGQLGVTGVSESRTPVLISTLAADVQAISAGYLHTCAIVRGGAQCWGNNARGQLGLPADGTSHAPAPVPGLASGVQAIVAAQDHTCALVTGGAIRCWGDNATGQLGNSTLDPSATPVTVTNLASGAQDVVTGYLHTCAIGSAGIQCWGNNGSGQLATNTTFQSTVPLTIAGLSSGVRAIAGGWWSVCAVVNGGAQCWGDNGSGQLGYAGIESRVPGRVTGLATGVQAITGGDGHTCALVNGGVQCWGSNFDGEVGNPSGGGFIPVPVTSLASNVQSIVAGSYHTCAIVDGGARCWGYNHFGELGNNARASSVTAVQVVGLTSGVQAIVGGAFHTCALVNGGVRCWGRNDWGQLGNNSTAPESLVPVPVVGLESGVLAITAGGHHNCALISSGLRCWGLNDHGQLGNNSTAFMSLVPVTVANLTSGVHAVLAGGYHTCAIVNGSARCWGLNGNGQVGNNSITTDIRTTVQVANLTSGVRALAGGGNHSCAIAGDGVQCWGANHDGALGNNSTALRSLFPVPVAPWAP